MADDTWLKKEDAARAIGISTKTLEKMAKAGEVRMEMWRRPSGGPLLAVYHPADVEHHRHRRGLQGRPAMVSVPTLAVADSSQNAVADSSRSVVVREPFEVAVPLTVDASQKEEPRVSELHSLEVRLVYPKAYLTINEAREATGLSLKLIREAARDGRVKKKGKAYRRRDLMAL